MFPCGCSAHDAVQISVEDAGTAAYPIGDRLDRSDIEEFREAVGDRVDPLVAPLPQERERRRPQPHRSGMSERAWKPQTGRLDWGGRSSAHSLGTPQPKGHLVGVVHVAAVNRHRNTRQALPAFARIDFRVDCDGSPWVIDVGVSPGIGPGSSAFRSARAEELSYSEFVRVAMATTLALGACFPQLTVSPSNDLRQSQP